MEVTPERDLIAACRDPGSLVGEQLEVGSIERYDDSLVPARERNDGWIVVPGRLSGAWVFRDTRMPVSAVFENIEAGATIDEIIEQFDVTREQINAVLEFAARSLAPAPLPTAKASGPDAHPL